MKNLIKYFSVIVCCFWVTNVFSVQKQVQTDVNKLAQQKITDKNLEQILVLLKEINSKKNQTNFSIGKELFLIGASGGMALAITGLLENHGIVDRIAGTPAGSSNIFSSVWRGIIHDPANDRTAAELVSYTSFGCLWVGTYILLKVLLILKDKLINKLNGNPFDQETKERLAKIENLLEQIKLTQEVKSINYSA